MPVRGAVVGDASRAIPLQVDATVRDHVMGPDMLGVDRCKASDDLRRALPWRIVPTLDHGVRGERIAEMVVREGIQDRAEAIVELDDGLAVGEPLDLLR